MVKAVPLVLDVLQVVHSIIESTNLGFEKKLGKRKEEKFPFKHQKLIFRPQAHLF